MSAVWALLVSFSTASRDVKLTSPCPFRFYPARYHKKYNSIFALGDICDLIPDESADVCILEEPEHLNWYRAPGCSSWSGKFRHCVGVIHTNYKAYARDHARAGFLAAPLLAGVNSLVAFGFEMHLGPICTMRS